MYCLFESTRAVNAQLFGPSIHWEIFAIIGKLTEIIVEKSMVLVNPWKS